jgi:hypothetical protein
LAELKVVDGLVVPGVSLDDDAAGGAGILSVSESAEDGPVDSDVCEADGKFFGFR